MIEGFSGKQQALDHPCGPLCVHDERTVLGLRPLISRKRVARELNHHQNAHEQCSSGVQESCACPRKPVESGKGPGGAHRQNRQPQLVVVRVELARSSDRDQDRGGHCQEQHRFARDTLPADERETEERDGHQWEERGHRAGQQVSGGQALKQVPGQRVGVEAVVGEDGAREIAEPPRQGEVTDDDHPGDGADRDDDGAIGQRPMPARRAPRGRNHMGSDEEGGAHRDDRFEECGQRKQNAGRDDPRPVTFRGAHSRQQRQRPDQAGVEEDLGVGLVSLQGEVAGRHDPERRSPQPCEHAQAPRPPHPEDPEKRRHRGEHTEKVYRSGSEAGHRLGGPVGNVNRRRLVVPQVRVECVTVAQAVGDHCIRREVALQRLVVRVEPRHQDDDGQQSDHGLRDQTEGSPDTERKRCYLECRRFRAILVTHALHGTPQGGGRTGAPQPEPRILERG